MSAASASFCGSKGSKESASISKKPWFITFNPDCKDAFVWKNGERLRLGDGSASGSITDICVCDTKNGVVMLSGADKSGTKIFKFRCMLSNFESDNNTFTRDLGPYINQPSKFCSIIKDLLQSPATEMKGDASEKKTKATKRPRTNEGASTSQDTQPPQKKSKKKAAVDLHIAEFEPEIMDHYIGTFSVSTSSLRDPPAYLCVREVKEWYVDYLVKTLEEETGDHEDLTSPLLGICSVTKESFQQKKMGSYSYWVIGGIQRFNAITKINEQGSRKIESRRCSVYGLGLSREATLVLAQQHNQINQIQRVTTFPEIAASCRRLLYEHFRSSEELEKTDDGVYMPEVPRYNTRTYRDWKNECMLFCVSPQVSESVVLQAIQMAMQDPQSYHLMQRVFSLCEEGGLKGQKQRKISPKNMKKALDGSFSAKLTHFKVFQGLPEGEKRQLLQDLADCDISFEDAVKLSKEKKQIKSLKETFGKELGMSWDEAHALIPDYANEKKLLANAGKDFMEFCSRAKLHIPCRHSDDASETQPEILVLGKSTITLYEQGLREHFKSPLVFINFSKVIDEEEGLDVITEVAGQNMRKTWTMLIYNNNTALRADYIKKQIPEFKICKQLFLCKTLFSVCPEPEDHGELGISEFLIVAWWGPEKEIPPTTHPLASKGNTIICRQDDDETGLEWIQFFFKSLSVKTKVVDVFSEHGEVVRVARLKDLDCVCITRNINTLMDILQPDNLEPETSTPLDEEQFTPELIDTPINTEELLHDLSDLTKSQPSKKMKSDLVTEVTSSPNLTPVKRRKRKEYGVVKTFQTRSRTGKSAQWNKSLDPDSPLKS